jgi:DNA adenine methylase
MNNTMTLFDLKIKANPFLKWAGGKTQLLEQYKKYLPCRFNKYIEPFLGGGALFFYLYNNDFLNEENRATLIDSNCELINCYQVVKDNVEELITTLSGSEYSNDAETYYEIRAQSPTDKVKRAARIIYLNKTCYNGLYRVNSKGTFNVPYGRYTNPKICDCDNLREVNKALTNTDIVCDDFRRAEFITGKDDFVYLDPPYQPLSKTSNFTNYTDKCFTDNEQIRLSRLFVSLDSKRCKVMLSNSDTPTIRFIYSKYRIETVVAKRAINCKATGRGKINELLILNY